MTSLTLIILLYGKVGQVKERHQPLPESESDKPY